MAKCMTLIHPQTFSVMQGYRHRYRGDVWRESGADSDREVVESGAISVTALTLGGFNTPVTNPIPFD